MGKLQKRTGTREDPLQAQAENHLKGDANLPFVRTFSRGSLYAPIETESRFFMGYINTKLTIEW